ADGILLVVHRCSVEAPGTIGWRLQLSVTTSPVQISLPLPANLVAELGESDLGISNDWHGNLIVLSHLVRIDVDLYESLAGLQATIPAEGAPFVETRPDGQEHVYAAFQQVPLRQWRAGIAKGTQGQVMVLWEHALPLGSRRDRDLERLRESPDLFGRIGENGAVPGKNGRPSSPQEVQGGLLDRGAIVVIDAMNPSRCQCRRGEQLLLHVGRQTQMHRPGSAAKRRAPSLVARVGKPLRATC